MKTRIYRFKTLEGLSCKVIVGAVTSEDTSAILVERRFFSSSKPLYSFSRQYKHLFYCIERMWFRESTLKIIFSDLGLLEKDFTKEYKDEYDTLIRENDKGELHSLYSPAIEASNGYKAWYQNGKLHRLYSPAEEYSDGFRVWYQNDGLHRLDGPAIEWSDGSRSWWYEDEFYGNSDNGYNQEEFEKDLKNRTKGEEHGN